MMYFITEPGFCQHFFGNIFGFLEKERLFIYFSFIFPASALLCEGLGDADAGRRGGKTALTRLPEVGGEQVAQCHSGSGGALLGRTALEVAERGSGHRAGSAYLGLTAALRARQRGAGRDDLPKAGGYIEGVADGFLVRLAAAGQPQLPAVGAATIRFMQALHSAVLRASAVTAAR